MGLSMFQGRIAMISQWVDGGNLPQYLSRYPNVDRIALVCIMDKAGADFEHTNLQIPSVWVFVRDCVIFTEGEW